VLHWWCVGALARSGPATTTAVPVPFPASAVLWGWIFLAEGITAAMVIGCAVILVGTALATGLVTLPGGQRKAAADA